MSSVGSISSFVNSLEVCPSILVVEDFEDYMLVKSSFQELSNIENLAILNTVVTQNLIQSFNEFCKYYNVTGATMLMGEEFLKSLIHAVCGLMNNKADIEVLKSTALNQGGNGRKLVNAFYKMGTDTPSKARENASVTEVLLTSYFSEDKYDSKFVVMTFVSKLADCRFMESLKMVVINEQEKCFLPFLTN